MTLICRRRAVSAILSMLLAAAGILGWWHFTKPNPWSDEREVEGAIYSAVTGKNPEGREILVAGGFQRRDARGFSRAICCYDVKNGQILWENDKAGYLELRGLQMNVAMDDKGDIFVTSHSSPFGHCRDATLEKLSGSSGNLIWAKDISVFPWISTGGYQMENFIVPPSIDLLGNIWLVEPTSAGPRYQVRLCVFDGLGGSLINDCPLNGSENLYTLPEIDCLKMGGALVFASGRGTEQSAYRFSAAGKLLHQFPVDFPPGSSGSLNLRRFVDEKHQRILISEEEWQDGYDIWGSSLIKTAAFDLKSGKKQWESSSKLQGTWGHTEGCLPQLTLLRANGDLEYRHESRIANKRIDWHRWESFGGIPLPARVITDKKCLARSLVSTADGSVGKSTLISSSENWFETQDQESGATTKEIYKQGFLEFYSLGRIRCRDARRWLPAATQTETGRQIQCFRVVRTPSGRVILSRDPNDYDFRPGERKWQIRAL